MSQSDKGFMGLLAFITLWVVLCSGQPDLLDALSDRVSGRNVCNVEEGK